MTTYHCLLCGTDHPIVMGLVNHTCFDQPSNRANPVTERDKQELRREGFLSGAQWGVGPLAWLDLRDLPNKAAARAAELFPYPKRRVPATWTDSGGREFRVVDGEVQTHGNTEAWSEADYLHITAERVEGIAKLLAQPFVEVDDE